YATSHGCRSAARRLGHADCPALNAPPSTSARCEKCKHSQLCHGSVPSATERNRTKFLAVSCHSSLVVSGVPTTPMTHDQQPLLTLSPSPPVKSKTAFVN